MDDFKADEELLRVIPNKPKMIKDNGCVSSALFKDSWGCSVSRQGERDIDVAVSTLKEKFNKIRHSLDASSKGVASVKYKYCKIADTYIKKCPSSTDIYHCEIHDSEHKIELSPGKAKKLAASAIIYK